MKVYLLIHETVINDTSLDCVDSFETRVFATRKKANKHFKELVDFAKNDWNASENDCYIENELFDYYEVYENGNFMNSHEIIRIIESEVE